MEAETLFSRCCGSQMEMKLLEAKNNGYFHPTRGGLYFWTYEIYNSQTGQKQFVPEVRCPNYKGGLRGMFDRHDRYVIDQIVETST